VGAFDRTIALVGEEKFALLERAHVLVVGLGGVGGAALEVLARSGVGKITVVDGDRFEPTNTNRQLLCTADTVGRSKAEVAAERVRAINPNAEVVAESEYVCEDNVRKLVESGCSYCIDCIDDIKNKVLLIKECAAQNVPIVSAMGAGNRIDCMFSVTDVFATKDDPFARKLRHELRAANINKLDTVCAISPPSATCGTPLSSAAPPIVMGAMLANHAVKNIIGF